MRVRAYWALSNTGHKNVSTYKRRRLFHVITDFRPVNDFFESLTPPRRAPSLITSHYHRVSSLVAFWISRLELALIFSTVYSYGIEIETRPAVTNLGGEILTSAASRKLFRDVSLIGRRI